MDTKRSLTLQNGRMSLAEQWRQDHVVSAEQGTTIEDILRPEYWCHVAPRMQQFDRVEVRDEAGEWIAELIVTSVGRNWACMHLAKRYEFAGVERQDAAPLSAFDIKWRGHREKWAVIRISDKAVIQDGLDSRTHAEAWLNNYEQVTAQPA